MTQSKEQSKGPEKIKRKGFSSKFNTFKVGFITGVLFAFLTSVGIGHLFLNVFQLGSITLGDQSDASISSSTENNTDDSNVQDVEESQVDQTVSEVESSSDVNQASDGSTVQENSNNRSIEDSHSLENSQINGESVSVTINYNNNSDLPGFDPNRGYSSAPPDISQFNDAILITNVGLGSSYATFNTREVFINKRKYDSTFYLVVDKREPTRVSFNLELPGVDAKGVLLQFGLADLSSGSTTLTYLVNIFGDGEIMWSNQVKYEESQIASVVLNTENVEDILVEYQIVESGGISTYNLDDYPLYFTEAKVLEN